MNVYFSLHENSSKDLENIRNLFVDLKLPIPSEERLAYHTKPGCFAMTFSWEHQDFIRACLYNLPVEPPADLAQFMDACALPNNEARDHPANSCAVSVSYDRHGAEYFKQESDWQNRYLSLINDLVDASQGETRH